ncbi:MAG: endonuclease III domain-containing protein [Thermodesulfobacteriota bacterium]|nr:endonuclease III domain-containing protein [Thermodesulfobacteriota bacterium]
MGKYRKNRRPIKDELMAVYNKLYQSFGPRNWWPADSPFEVIVGAVLTQNTSWKNVEKAIKRLKEENLLSLTAIYRVDVSYLAETIRSSGFYKLKAKRLKNLIEFIFKNFGGEIEGLTAERMGTLREKLLNVNGIGPETADSIMLYALEKPIFVVDAYTRRILSRHDLISENASYSEIQQLFIDNLPQNARLYNEYHALIVYLGNTICKKRPLCDRCPLNTNMTYGHNRP